MSNSFYVRCQDYLDLEAFQQISVLWIPSRIFYNQSPTAPSSSTSSLSYVLGSINFAKSS